MTDFKKGDLIFINSNQFADAVKQFRDKWTVTATVTVTAMATATAMGTAMATAMKTVTVTGTVTYPFTVKSRQSDEKVKLKHYGTDWKQLDQNLTGIIQKVVSEQHPDFDMLKVYCQQEGSVMVFRRFILERIASRQPASLTHLLA